jgi:DNA (cytosine-5)-methyltransferase 1
MEHREVKTPEQIAALKAKSPGGYRNLRETVINELFPTPITSDYKNGKSSAGYGLNLPETAKSLMPTPKALDGVKGNLKTSQERIDSGRQVDLPNVAIDLIGTPRANAANSSSKQVEAGAPKSRIEDQVLTTNWGKFEPAIRRWESIIGRPAPEPTKPDGKDGNHRLSSKFTEWMMGLPDGWITGHDLKRNDELKLAGNGVVPQQAELALRLLLDLPEER